MPVRAGDAYGSLPGADILAAINYACAERRRHRQRQLRRLRASRLAIGNAIKSSLQRNPLRLRRRQRRPRPQQQHGRDQHLSLRVLARCAARRRRPEHRLRRRHEHQRRARRVLEPRQVCRPPRSAGRRHLQLVARVVVRLLGRSRDELPQLDGCRRHRGLAADDGALQLGVVEHDRLSGRQLPEHSRTSRSGTTRR